jgi:GNAT superfamily N-acetyltransferase
VTPELVPASRLSLRELAELFTASFEGYVVPMHVDEASFARMVELFDLDLGASLVAAGDGRPIGLANLGIRGEEGWVGGMGVVPDERRHGVGELLMRGLHEAGRARGVRKLVLEVIDSNAAAIALYAKLGYEHVRDLELWILDADPTATAAREVPAAAAHARVRELRRAPEPWQRADATVERLLVGDPRARGLEVDGGVAVLRVTPQGVVVDQIAARDDAAARELLAAALSDGRPLRLTNLPSGDPAAEAFAALGGRVELRQHELRLAV